MFIMEMTAEQFHVARMMAKTALAMTEVRFCLAVVDIWIQNWIANVERVAEQASDGLRSMGTTA